jgi:hypothetical protein
MTQIVCGHSYCSPCLAAGGRCPHHPGPKWKPSPAHIVNVSILLPHIVININPQGPYIDEIDQCDIK